jgi:peptidoglycan/xylan/chitin deacetylase (PgdA/CDA1 family)
MRLARRLAILAACAAAAVFGINALNAPSAQVPLGPYRVVQPRGAVPVQAARAVTPVIRCLRVPVLMYHYIRVNLHADDVTGYELSVTPDAFAAQMDWLRMAGGHPVTLAQIMTALAGGPPLPPHAVVLTFDDGYADFATAAFPVLQAEHFVATDFVVSGNVGHAGYMSAAQVQEMAAAGMVIGAHTVHHVDLVAASPEVASIEISASRSALQDLLHRQVLDFAYPYGAENPLVAALVAQAGFRDAVTTAPGDLQCSSHAYLLERERVGGSDTVSSFAMSAGVAEPPPGWHDPGLPPDPVGATVLHTR